MFINTKTQAFDGDYQIIFSDTFNLYENRLILTDIVGYTFEVIFDKEDFNLTTTGISSQADEVNKKVIITVKNFRNQLGAGSTNKLPIINLQDGRKVFFAVYGKSLSKEIDFLHITVNFYLK